jgi:hypothetical protein
MHKVATTFIEIEVSNVKPLDFVDVLSSKTLICNKIKSQKVIVDVSKKIVLFAIEQMKDFLFQCPTHHA